MYKTNANMTKEFYKMKMNTKSYIETLKQENYICF